jgi:hypothetical protein
MLQLPFQNEKVGAMAVGNLKSAWSWRERLLMAFVGLSLGPVSAFADDYPNRLIKIVQPFASGGSTDVLARGLGGVDSKDSLLGANQIQGSFLGGSLGCDGPLGFERRGVGADGAADHRSA